MANVPSLHDNGGGRIVRKSLFDFMSNEICLLEEVTRRDVNAVVLVSLPVLL